MDLWVGGDVGDHYRDLTIRDVYYTSYVERRDTDAVLYNCADDACQQIARRIQTRPRRRRQRQRQYSIVNM